MNKYFTFLLTVVFVIIASLLSTSVIADDDVTIVDECGTDPIYIYDEELHKALIEHDIDTNKDKIISVCEAEAFEGDLHLAGRNIWSTVGLYAFRNARSIDLTDNYIYDFHLVALPNLEELRLRNTGLQSLSFIHNGDFRSLKVLDISDNDLDPQEFLAFDIFSQEEDEEKIFNIETLYIANLELEDIGFLVNVRHSLKHLYAENNLISDMETISLLTKLEYLDLENNLVADIELIGSLSSLQFLDLSINNVEDIEEITKLRSLNILHIGYNYLDVRENILENNIFGEGRIDIQTLLDEYEESNKQIFITYETQKPMIQINFPTYYHVFGEEWEDPEGVIYRGTNTVAWDEVIVSGKEIDQDTTPGTYYIHYDFIDEFGHEARRVTRTVIVQDAGIDFTLIGESSMTLEIGDLYTEPGYIAVNLQTNTDITNQVFEHGFVDTQFEGVYTIRYQIESEFGEQHELIRTITVVDNTPEVVEETQGDNFPTTIVVVLSSVTLLGGTAFFLFRKGVLKI